MTNDYIVWDTNTCAKYLAFSGEALNTLQVMDLECMHDGVGGCCDLEYRQVIDDWCNIIVNALLCCLQQIHNEQKGRSKSSSGRFVWTDELQCLKQKSIDIVNLWKVMGRPRNGYVNAERLRVKYVNIRVLFVSISYYTRIKESRC